MMAMMMMMMPALCRGEHLGGPDDGHGDDDDDASPEHLDYNANNPHDANFNHDGVDRDCNVFPKQSFGVPIDSEEGIAQRGGDPW